MVRVNYTNFIAIDDNLRKAISLLFKITEGMDVDFFIRKFKVRKKIENDFNRKLNLEKNEEILEHEMAFLGVATLDKMPNILEAEQIIEFDSKDSIQKFLSKNTLVLQFYNNYFEPSIFSNYKYIMMFLELINEWRIKSGSAYIEEETINNSLRQIILIYKEDVKNKAGGRK